MLQNIYLEYNERRIIVFNILGTRAIEFKDYIVCNCNIFKLIPEKLKENSNNVTCIKNDMESYTYIKYTVKPLHNKTLCNKSNG